jgi:uncharacterized phage protein (TIGR02218 family)
MSGNTWFATGIATGAWSRGSVRTALGLKVSHMDLSVSADTTAVLSGIPLLQAMQIGLFDGAIVRCETLYMPTYGDTSLGTVIDFVGEITNIDEVGRSRAKMTVAGYTFRLDWPVPGRLMQPACSNTLFDAGCTLNQASFATAKVLAGGSTQSLLVPSVAFSQADGYFTLGQAFCTSGANVDLIATIKSHAGGQIQLHVPLPLPVAPGDGFTFYPGCDKLQATCNTKFSNLINFGGEPYVPVPETTL